MWYFLVSLPWSKILLFGLMYWMVELLHRVVIELRYISSFLSGIQRTSSSLEKTTTIIDDIGEDIDKIQQSLQKATKEDGYSYFKN